MGSHAWISYISLLISLVQADVEATEAKEEDVPEAFGVAVGHCGAFGERKVVPGDSGDSSQDLAPDAELKRMKELLGDEIEAGFQTASSLKMFEA